MAFEEGLNDQALQALEEESSFVKAPAPAPANTALPDAVVISDPAAVTPDDAISALQDYDVKLVTLEQGVVKQHSLEDVTDTILAAESISRSDAEHYSRIIGESFQDALNLKEYTEAPSRTNLIETKRFAEQAKQTSYEELEQHLIAFAKQEWVQAAAVVQWLESEAVQSLLADLRRLGEQAAYDLPLVAASKHFYVQNESRMVDIRNVVMNEPNREQFEACWEGSSELINRIDHLFRHPGFLHLKTLGGRATVPTLDAFGSEVEKRHACFTYVEFTTLLASQAITNALDAVLADVTARWPALNQAMQEPDLEKLDANLPEIRHFLEDLVLLQAVIVGVQPLPLYGKALLKLFSDQADRHD